MVTASKHLLQQIVLTRPRLIPRLLLVDPSLAASRAATVSLSALVSETEHATPTPVDVCTAPARMIEHVAPAPVIEYIAPSAAVSYPSFFPSFDQIHEAVADSEKPQFSITADETSQMPVERIQEQSAVSDLVTSVESSPVVDSVPLLHAMEYIMPEPRVPVPQIQEQVIVQGIPRAQVGERIQEQIAETVKEVPQERVQQPPVEQIVRVPVPLVQEQGIVQGIPRAQVVTRIGESVLNSAPMNELCACQSKLCRSK